MKNNTNYTEGKIKEAKEIIDRTNNTKDTTGHIVGIAYNYKYKQIKSIDIKIRNDKIKHYSEVYAVTSSSKYFIALIKDLDSAKFDKVLNGSIKIIPANMSLFMNDFNELFTIKVDDEDTQKYYFIDNITLKDILRLCDEFIVHHDDYKEFNDLTFYCNKAMNFKDAYSLSMFNMYYEKHGNMKDALSNYFKDIETVWNKLPKRYKPLNYKSFEDIKNFESRFTNSLKEIYLASIKDYEKRIKDIDSLKIEERG